MLLRPSLRPVPLQCVPATPHAAFIGPCKFPVCSVHPNLQSLDPAPSTPLHLLHVFGRCRIRIRALLLFMFERGEVASVAATQWLGGSGGETVRRVNESTKLFHGEHVM